MVHHRINEKEINPNSYINFITALPTHDDTEQESARQLLRALAAQVRPVMKSHGFSVNSLEEYEHNNVFAGRNWNAGETVELVLRRPDRTFLPTFWLMSTLCHELAHIKVAAALLGIQTYYSLSSTVLHQHMNHGPSFQALWKRLNAEVRALQDKGYYGDGYWSAGTRLADNARVAGEGIEPGDLPEYMCGGAQTRRRPTATRTRRPRKPRDTTITASTSSGRQTAKRRKAGARVTSKIAFVGEGMALAVDAVDSKGKGKGTGFGKQAASKRAREERALATERRILALQGQAKATSSSSTVPSTFDSESESDDDEVEDAIPETDSDRRQALLTSEGNDDLDKLKSGSLWEHFENNFIFSGSQGQSSQEPELSCDLPLGSGSTGTAGASTSKAKRKKYESDDDDDIVVILPATKLSKTSTHVSSQKEKLELVSPHTKASPESQTLHKPVQGVKEELPPTHKQWACLVCTLNNKPDHLACSACATPRGEETWTHH